MSERARALADRFEHANHELIATVEACSDAAWRAKTTGEGLQDLLWVLLNTREFLFNH